MGGRYSRKKKDNETTQGPMQRLWPKYKEDWDLFEQAIEDLDFTLVFLTLSPTFLNQRNDVPNELTKTNSASNYQTNSSQCALNLF